MKPGLKMFVVLILVLATTAAAWCHVAFLKVVLAPYHVTNANITVNSNALMNANTAQINSDVEIVDVNGKLYYYMCKWFKSLGRRSRFEGCLCTIEEGKIHKLLKIDALYGSDSKYIYYKLDNKVLAYDPITEKSHTIGALSDTQKKRTVISSDGTLRLTAYYDEVVLCNIKDGELDETGDNIGKCIKYDLNGKSYSIRGRSNKVFCNELDISDCFGEAEKRLLVPYQEGLLLINSGCGDLVYYIQKDGTISQLFPGFSCMCSDSSVNFYENYVFVSFRRWEAYSNIGLKPYDNDMMQGTYRIDIKTNAVEKISEHIYSGMFIFDDSGIFACDGDGNIHLIDFDGNVLKEIVD